MGLAGQSLEFMGKLLQAHRDPTMNKQGTLVNTYNQRTHAKPALSAALCREGWMLGAR